MNCERYLESRPIHSRPVGPAERRLALVPAQPRGGRSHGAGRGLDGFRRDRLDHGGVDLQDESAHGPRKPSARPGWRWAIRWSPRGRRCSARGRSASGSRAWTDSSGPRKSWAPTARVATACRRSAITPSPRWDLPTCGCAGCTSTATCPQKLAPTPPCIDTQLWKSLTT